MQTFSITLPKKFSVEGKWLLTVTSFGATNSVCKKTDGNKSFLISKPIRLTTEDDEAISDKIKEISELRSQKDSDLHVKEVEKGCTRIELEIGGYSVPGFVYLKSGVLAELKEVIYKVVDDMVFRMELTYDENIEILDIKEIAL